jgi:glycosyltransferase involved in cell wall biosynthesis
LKNFISVLTATYNRGKYLKKLYKSLLAQKIKNFEWIIADDGSNDQTEKIIKKFINENKIQIIYIKSNLRIGKCVLDNILLKKANGKFILHCDSDDYLKKDVFSFFVKTYNKNKNQFKQNIIGIISQNLSTEGVSQTYYSDKLPQENKIYYYEDIAKLLKGDATIFCKRNVFKNVKFPEVDFISNEGVILEGLYNGKKFLVSKKIIKIMDRNSDLSVSFGNKLRYCRGSLYCIVRTTDKKKYYTLNTLSRLKLLLNYARYSIHSDYNYSISKNKWSITKNKKNYFLYYIVAYLICVRDHVLNKIEKTHREFDINKKKYTISEVASYKKIKLHRKKS